MHQQAELRAARTTLEIASEHAKHMLELQSKSIMKTARSAHAKLGKEQDQDQSEEPMLNEKAPLPMDIAGSESLLCSAVSGDFGTAYGMIQRGVDKNSQDRDGQSALHKAVTYGHSGIALVLLQAGADVNGRDVQGMTALHSAVEKGRTGIAHTLLKFRADIEAVDRRDNTPLLLAAAHGHLQTVQYLIGVGANPRATDCGAALAVEMAGKNGYEEIVKFLLACSSTHAYLVGKVVNKVADVSLTEYDKEQVLEGRMAD
jgi:hypothetical protein